MLYHKLAIVLAFLLGLVLTGCTYNRQLKIVSDIAPNGKITYHAEFTTEF